MINLLFVDFEHANIIIAINLFLNLRVNQKHYHNYMIISRIYILFLVNQVLFEAMIWVLDLSSSSKRRFGVIPHAAYLILLQRFRFSCLGTLRDSLQIEGRKENIGLRQPRNNLIQILTYPHIIHSIDKQKFNLLSYWKLFCSSQYHISWQLIHLISVYFQGLNFLWWYFTHEYP